MKILIIQNCAGEDLGLINRVLEEEKIPVDTAHPYRGDPFPSAGDHSVIIIGGTPDSVYRKDEIGYLGREFEYLTEIVPMDIPILGICGGAQLLSMVLGGEVKPNGIKEIGCYQVVLTLEGKGSPLFAVWSWLPGPGSTGMNCLRLERPNPRSWKNSSRTKKR